MGGLRAMVVLPADSNKPSDVSVNVWHFRTTSFVPAGYDEIALALKTFYNNFTSILSPAINHAGCSIKFYDIFAPTPRPTVAERAMALNPLSGTAPLPPELAICMSFQGPKLAGVPQARRRGRIYIGPLATDVNLSGIVNNLKVTAIKNAAAAFLVTNDAAATWKWSVLSSYNNADNTGAPGENMLTPVTEGWVDDAFDVQRRRGIAATNRDLFT